MPVSWRLVPTSDAAAWTAALDGLPHGVAHTRDWCAAIEASAARPTHLFAVDDGRGGRLACPVAERAHEGTLDLVTPYGLAGPTGDAVPAAVRAAWAQLAVERGYVTSYVGLSPFYDRPAWHPDGTVRVERDLFVLDLDGTEEERRARLSANRRRQLKRAVRLDFDEAGAADFFVRTFPASMALLRAAPVYRFTADTLAALTRLPGALLVAAGEESVEAVSLFATRGTTAEFLFTASTAAGRRLATHVIWEAARRLKARGARQLALGGGVRRGDDLEEFKRRFGGARVPLRARCEVHRPDEFRRLCAAAGVPATADGYFPPWHAPR